MFSSDPSEEASWIVISNPTCDVEHEGGKSKCSSGEPRSCGNVLALLEFKLCFYLILFKVSQSKSLIFFFNGSNVISEGARRQFFNNGIYMLLQNLLR